MKKTTFTFVLSFLFLQMTHVCLSQENEFKPNWEISMSSGQSFVDYIEGFGTGYNTGLTFSPQVSYNFSKLFSTSLSLYFTTAHSGNDKANLNKVYLPEPSEGVRIASHYQTTLSPSIEFIPLRIKNHQILIGVGPTYTFGNSLLSETFGETSTTLFRHVDEIGYLGSVGYHFSFGKSWSMGGKYIYNQAQEKTEHLLLSLRYRIN